MLKTFILCLMQMQWFVLLDNISFWVSESNLSSSLMIKQKITFEQNIISTVNVLIPNHRNRNYAEFGTDGNLGFKHKIVQFNRTRSLLVLSYRNF